MLWVELGDSEKKTARRFLLQTSEGSPCENLTEAKIAFDQLRVDRQKSILPMSGRKPNFPTWADGYLKLTHTLSKTAGTLENETQALERWKKHLGFIPVDKVSTPMISAYKEKRLKGLRFGERKFKPASPRTVDLDFTILRNVLKAAKEAGYLRKLPDFPRIKVPSPNRRSLITPADFGRLLESCMAHDEVSQVPITKNGEQLRDFFRLLAFCGCREQEGLRIRWLHVDFENKRLFIGAPDNFKASEFTVGSGGVSKNHGSRIVDFNPQLEHLLLDMKDRKQEGSSWLFPSPQRGKKDINSKTFRDSLNKVRDHANLPDVGFHDLRHLFCSFGVMAGIDFMTIAAWLGHKDGGILIGKVYGHLLDEHRKKMAAKLTIGI